MIKKIFRYSTFGTIATFIDFVALIIQIEILGLNIYFALILSFLLAASVNHVLNRHYTFRTTQSNIRIEYLKFITVSACGVFINIFTVFILSDKLETHYLFAKIIATCIVMFWNFLLNYHWTFKIKN